MDTDRNLLFGVLALQADLIDARQFIEACTLWAAHKATPLAELLVERGWLRPDDREHVEYLLGRKLEKHGGDVRTGLATAGDEIKRSLAALGDADIARSLAHLPRPCDPWAATIDHLPAPADRYLLARLHATGGIGRVWLARDAALGREVALKELRPEKAGDAALCARFCQEARITGQLEHPGVVPVYELARRTSDGQPFYTMRFVKGRTLTEAARDYHLRRREGRADPLDFAALIQAFVAVGNTVAYAHARGVLHRDLKGQNVVLGDFGEVVVLDWGLAKRVGDPEGSPGQTDLAGTEGHPSNDHTLPGQTLGTPPYMAPEQADGRPDLIDARTDVYGLGAILYEILTGQPPISGSDTLDVLRRVREEPPAPPHLVWPEVPPGLEAVCLRALAKRPAERLASAVEVVREVQGWQDAERRKAEEALRASEALYHSLVETLPLGVWRKDLDGRFTFANRRFCESLGVSPDGILGKTDLDFFPRELAEKYRRDDARVHASGTTLEEMEDHVTIRGDRLYVQVVKSPIFDGRGQVIGTQGMFWDLTEWRRNVEELRRSRERFELAVLGSQDGLWDWDIQTNEVWYSPRYKSMLGYQDEEFPNRVEEWRDRLHPDDRELVLAALRAHLEGQAPEYQREHRLRHKDGSYVWVLARGVARRDAAGRPYRMAGSHEDITERKRTEERLRQALQRVARLEAELVRGAPSAP